MSSDPRGEEAVLSLPQDLAAALAAAPMAECAWSGLTGIGRRDFISWINEAKLPETRQRRIKRACENLVAGKRRPCCYAVVPMDLYRALGDEPALKASWSNLTADEKRDFSDWVEASPDRETRKARVKEACAKLAAGKRGP